MISYKINIDNKGTILAGVNSAIKGKLINNKEIDELVDEIRDKRENSSRFLRELGEKLFEILLPEKTVDGEPRSVRQDFNKYYEKCLAGEYHMQIRLSIDDDHYQSYPWELLHDKIQYLGVGSKVSFVRVPRVTEPNNAKTIENGPIRILILKCTPSDAIQLEYANREVDVIYELFRDKLKEGAYNIDILSSDSKDKKEWPTFENIKAKLGANKYNIIHYIGHSDFSYENESEEGDSENEGYGTIYLSNSEGRILHMKDDVFANLFDQYRVGKNLGLVVLNSCYSGIEKGFSGLSRKLIEKRIPCIIGMQFKVLDDVGPHFAQHFYNKFIDDEFSPEQALTSFRESLYGDLEGPMSREFVCPVMYLALRDDAKGKILKDYPFKSSLNLVHNLSDFENSKKNQVLIISIENYNQIQISNLVGAENLAAEMYAVFDSWRTSDLAISKEHYLISNQANLVAMKKAISNIFRTSNPSKLVLIYFSGIIYVDRYFECYFAPSDSGNPDPYIDGINIKELEKEICRSKNSSKVVVLLDCYCKASTPGPEKLMDTVKNVLRDFSDTNRVVIASLRLDDTAEDSQNESSVNTNENMSFTLQLLKALRGEGADKLGIMSLQSIRFFIDEALGTSKPLVFPENIQDKLLSDFRIGLTDEFKSKVNSYIEEILQALETPISPNELKTVTENIEYLGLMLNSPDMNERKKSLIEKINKSFEEYKNVLHKWLNDNSSSDIRGRLDSEYRKLNHGKDLYNSLSSYEDHLNFNSFVFMKREDPKIIRLTALFDYINRQIKPDVFIERMIMRPERQQLARQIETKTDTTRTDTKPTSSNVSKISEHPQ